MFDTYLLVVPTLNSILTQDFASEIEIIPTTPYTTRTFQDLYR